MLKEKFSKLVDVKSIITFALVGAVIGFTAAGMLTTDTVANLALMAVSFFFGVKATEKSLLK